jgi:hypothetical protein
LCEPEEGLFLCLPGTAKQETLKKGIGNPIAFNETAVLEGGAFFQGEMSLNRREFGIIRA